MKILRASILLIAECAGTFKIIYRLYFLISYKILRTFAILQSVENHFYKIHEKKGGGCVYYIII